MKWFVIPIIVLIILILGYIAFKYAPSYLIDSYLEKKAVEVLEERSSILIIEVRDKDGYLVHVPDEKKMHSIRWIDIKKIELSTGDIELFIYRLDVVDTINANTSSGFLNLIKAIPPDILMNERLVAFKKNYFKDLSCCDICGKVSLKEGECLHCGNTSHEQYVNNKKLMGITEDEGKLEYIRREQLFWFDDQDEINFYDNYFLFEGCINWKPSVTKAEVIKYRIED